MHSSQPLTTSSVSYSISENEQTKETSFSNPNSHLSAQQTLLRKRFLDNVRSNNLCPDSKKENQLIQRDTACTSQTLPNSEINTFLSKKLRNKETRNSIKTIYNKNSVKFNQEISRANDHNADPSDYVVEGSNLKNQCLLTKLNQKIVESMSNSNSKSEIDSKREITENTTTPRNYHINMLKIQTIEPSFLTMTSTQYFLPLKQTTSNIISLPEYKLIFSTLVLDSSTQSPVLIEKENLGKIVSQSAHVGHLPPHFHIISVVHKNMSSIYLNVLDLEDNIQITCDQSKEASYSPNTISHGIIVLFTANCRKEYRPHLTGNYFSDMQTVKKAIFENHPLQQERIPATLLCLSRAFLIPLPIEKGNLFFPNCYQENETKLRFYDLQIPLLPLEDPNLYYNINSMIIPFSGKYVNCFKPENKPVASVLVSSTNLTVRYDDILCHLLANQFTESTLENIIGKTLAFPFSFPVDQNLNECLVFPDKLILNSGKHQVHHFRQHRTPLFYILFSFRTSGSIRQIVLHCTAIGLFVYLQGNYFFFNFPSPISSTLITTRSKMNLEISERETVPCETPAFLSSLKSRIIEVTSFNPAKIISVGESNSKQVKIVSEYGMSINKHSDITSGELMHNLDSFLNIPPPILYSSNLHQHSPSISFNPPVSEDNCLTTQIQEMSNFPESKLSTSSPAQQMEDNKRGLNVKNEVMEFESPTVKGNNEAEYPFPIWPDDFYDKKTIDPEPQMETEEFNVTQTKSNMSQFKTKCKRVFNEVLDLFSDMETSLAQTNIKKTDDNKSDKGKVGFDQSTEFWNKYLKPPKLTSTHNVAVVNYHPNFSDPPINGQNSFHNENPFEYNMIQEETLENLIQNSPNISDFLQPVMITNPLLENSENHIDSTNIENLLPDSLLYQLSPQESHPWEKFPMGLDSNKDEKENSPKECHTFVNQTNQKYLFLFENDAERNKQTQAKKLLSVLHIDTFPQSRYQKLTFLVDTGSDISLISIKKLKALMSDEYIQKHLQKENTVLTSFSNNGIKLIGNIDLRIKFNSKDFTRKWKFLVVDQECLVPAILGNDLIMHFAISINMHPQKGPSLSLPNGLNLETYNAGLDEISQVSCFVELLGEEYKIVKVKAHPALNILNDEKILVEGIDDSQKVVIPLVCNSHHDGRIPIALKNYSIKPIQMDVHVKISILDPGQEILNRDDIVSDRVYSIHTPVCFTRDQSCLQLEGIEKTKERNVYRVEVQYQHNSWTSCKKNNLMACEINQSQNSNSGLAKERIGSNPDDEILGESPMDFMKDLDTKLLPDGYEVPSEKADINDLIQLQEYPPCFRARIKDIFIDKYSKVISKHDYEIGSLSNTMGPIKIFLKPNAYLPPIDKVYYLQQEQGQHLRDILDYLLKEQIIQQCSPNCNTGYNNFSSPAYLVGKSNPHKSAYRLIINYKDLNEELLTQFPVLPNISQYLQRLSSAYVFSQFDLSSAFYSLSLDEESQRLTMFTTCQGNFLFKRLPMGLAQSPSSFSVVANNLIHTKPARDRNGQVIYDAPNLVRMEPDHESNVLLYFDDVLIFSEYKSSYLETIEHHFDIIERVMQKLHFHDARLKWSKTEIAKTDILFLGHRISRGVLYADPRRVEKLLLAKFPENNVTGMKSFLGLINCLRTYLPQNIMKNIVKLQELTSGKYKPLPEHYEAFEKVKEALTQEPLYTNIIRPDAEYLLFCDAATGKHSQFSGVLTQVVDDLQHVPTHLNLCDPVQNYIFQEKLPYQAIPRYLSNEFICKSKVDKKIYDPLLFNSYYEKPSIGYSKENIPNSLFISIQSIYYNSNCQPLRIQDVRREAALNCKKTLDFHKLKTYAFGGHHLRTKEFLSNFENGTANVDPFLFIVNQIAKIIHRSIILMIYNEEDSSVQKRIFNPNNKVPLIIGLYKVQGEFLFSPFKSTFYNPMDPNEFKDRIQIVSFYAKSIPSSTANLDIMQLEALGIIYCLTYFKQFIKLSKLTIVTDNLVFFSIFSKKILDHSTIMSRYALKLLTQFPGVKIRHILTKHNLADFLTREKRIDKQSFQRLPLKAFRVNEDVAKLIDQKQSFTLMEFSDFVQTQQNYVLVDQTSSKELGYKNQTQAKAILFTCANIMPVNKNQKLSFTTPRPDLLYEKKPVLVFDSGQFQSELSPHEEKYLSLDLNSFAITRSKTRALDQVKQNNSSTPSPLMTEQSATKENDSVSSLVEKKMNNEKSIPSESITNIKKSIEPKSTELQKPTGNIEKEADEEITENSLSTDQHVKVPSLNTIRKNNQEHQRNQISSKFRMQDFWVISKQLEQLCSYENLIKEQKESYPELISQCQNSEGFKIYKGEKCYRLQNGILKIEKKDGDLKILLPSHQVGTIIALFHLSTFHKGANAIFNVMNLYYHENLFQLIKMYVTSCYRCLLVNKKKQEQLGHVPAIRVGYTFHIDLLENLNPQRSYKHILVCVDAFSKLMLTYPLTSKTTRQTIPYILYCLYQMFNIRYLISDNGPAFSSFYFKKTVNDLGIKHITISPNNPRSNGQAEKNVGLLKEMFRKALAVEQNENWLDILPIITKTHNTCKLAKTNLSPLEIVFGENSPNSITSLTNPHLNIDHPPYINATETQQQMAHKIQKWKTDLNRQREQAKKRINKNLPKTTFVIGDFVVIRDFGILPGINKTLFTKFRNELFVVKKVKSHSLVVLSLVNHTMRIVSTTNLKKINIKNLQRIDLPQSTKKLLLQDSYNLTTADFKTIAAKGASLILPEITEEEFEELSDVEIDEDEEEIVKRVRFALDEDNSTI